jgi:hypothetical protein
MGGRTARDKSSQSSKVHCAVLADHLSGVRRRLRSDPCREVCSSGWQCGGNCSVVEGLIGKLTELTLDAIPTTTKIGFLAKSIDLAA